MARLKRHAAWVKYFWMILIAAVVMVLAEALQQSGGEVYAAFLGERAVLCLRVVAVVLDDTLEVE